MITFQGLLISKMRKYKIAILGGGNIGTSLAKGLINSKQFTHNDILITEKREPRIAYLKELGFRLPITTMRQ